MTIPISNISNVLDHIYIATQFSNFLLIIVHIIQKKLKSYTIPGEHSNKTKSRSSYLHRQKELE